MPKTHTRINQETKKLQDIACPYKQDNGGEFTEDFDGLQTINGKQVFLNFKCVVGSGGSQT